MIERGAVENTPGWVHEDRRATLTGLQSLHIIGRDAVNDRQAVAPGEDETPLVGPDQQYRAVERGVILSREIAEVNGNAIGGQHGSVSLKPVLKRHCSAQHNSIGSDGSRQQFLYLRR